MKAPVNVNENKGSGKGFQSPEEGKHRAWLYRMVDLGTQKTEFKGEVSHKRQIMFLWELPDSTLEDGRPLVIPKTYTFSMFEKARLAMDIDAWFDGEAYEGMGSPDEFDLETLFDTPCELTVEKKGQSTYVTKVGRCKTTEGLSPRSNATVAFSLDAFDQDTYDGFSDNMKARIALSPEYEKIMHELKTAADMF